MADIETALTGQFSRDPQLSSKLDVPKIHQLKPSTVSKSPEHQDLADLQYLGQKITLINPRFRRSQFEFPQQ
jgi:hypothetical protein